MSKRLWPCIMICVLSLGESLSAHVVSVAACGFDPATSETQPMSEAIYMLINVEDAVRNGATIDQRSWQAILRTPDYMTTSLRTHNEAGQLMTPSYTEFTVLTQLNYFIKQNLAPDGTVWHVDTTDAAHLMAMALRAECPLGIDPKNERTLTTLKAALLPDSDWPHYNSLDMRDACILNAHLVIRCMAALTYYKNAATPSPSGKSEHYFNDYDPKRSEHHPDITTMGGSWLAVGPTEDSIDPVGDHHIYGGPTVKFITSQGVVETSAQEAAFRQAEMIREVQEGLRRPMDVQMLIDQTSEPQPEPEDWWKNLKAIYTSGTHSRNSYDVITMMVANADTREQLLQELEEYIDELHVVTGLGRLDLVPDDMELVGAKGDMARAIAFVGSLYRPGDDVGPVAAAMWRPTPDVKSDDWNTEGSNDGDNGPAHED